MSEKWSVLILMGSDSDWEVMQEAAKMLKEFEVGYEMTVSSAHRSPERTRRLIHEAEERGVQVIIAGAGGAAHLAGVIAAETILPVIGVPIPSALNGLDSLLSTVQMPGGIPVASMAIGKAGAKNAGIFAAQIVARRSPETAKRLLAYKKSLAEEMEAKGKRLHEKGHSD
ncbi:MAG: 5-(carboxyamino)imidazole ribonucleotide mutase [Candidatus Manganitrophus sp.]|nr:5-(carboxyamino)imidazole ribonucleotide mutase [Candidatus Manganitrophus sp.]MDC4223337.1 5-(carboxyamino)imidazole ribonucleotide mutase [Candidatus Manganitrophus sp.]WDT71577.1 MAG: 5-(carboxyamino)imidazole ribonucleotide mutase [Candidatus Manganitrophus sp.]WDT81085.1 MAG: 5-(carboxyamino)imidazole ribonucleotide mutase [Candidatus Manganitrophus sp.]